MPTAPIVRAKGFEPSKPVDFWFFTVLRNAFVDSRRRFDRRKVLSLDIPLDGEDGASFEDIIPDGAEGPQNSLELCDMGGLAYDDVARSLGVSVGTVRSRIFRARATLRGQLAAY